MQRLPSNTLPIIHLVFANLKTWLTGIHHGVSHQHLQAYRATSSRSNPLQPATFYPVQRLPLSACLGNAAWIRAATPLLQTYAELYSGELGAGKRGAAPAPRESSHVAVHAGVPRNRGRAQTRTCSVRTGQKELLEPLLAVGRRLAVATAESLA